ncbi:EAL domain-containing protein [Celerinatantimonas yamalensis]|uniref:EAL domain-containing protein n=1 Tax=Celerinatantimonas yamalensis TaxID=559956 RepID=A0ABW9G353_9GAMM
MSEDGLLSQFTGFPLKWSWDVTASVMRCSEQLPLLLGYPEVTSITLSQLIASAELSQREILKECIRDAYQGQHTREVRIVVNGSQRFIALLCIWTDPALPKLIQGTLEFLIDVPSQQVEFDLFYHLFVHAHVGMLVLDNQQRILMANQEFCRTTGFQENELLGVSAELFGGHDSDPALYQRIWQTVAKKGFWIGELLARDKQGYTFAHELTLQRIVVNSDKRQFFVAISKRLDISMAHLLDDEGPTSTTVQNESLSKFPNASEFKQVLGQHFNELPSDQTIVVFVFQPYFSKNISVSMSHWLIGNRLIELPNEMTLGVFTPELFAGFIVVPRNLGVIHRHLQTLLALVCNESQESGESDEIGVHVNIGVSILGTDAVSVSQLISHASQALVATRERDKSMIIYFDNRLQKKMDHKQVLSRLLDKSIKQNTINVFYQPIVDLNTLKIVKFEALFRVKLDTKLPYNTQELIQLAEENGWIDRIDMAVTRRALIDLAALQTYFKNPALQLSVNRSMHNDRLSHCCLEDTLNIIMEARIDPSLVTVELTESSLLADIDRQMVWIDRLKKQGIEIAIDDFGTGYSSFSYLLNLPINIIKIDRSFVTELKMGSNAYMMIEMVTSLVHQMGGKVVAEGVETSEVLHMLSQAKVDYAQGYLLSKPMSLKDIVAGQLAASFPSLQRVLITSKVQHVRDVMQREFLRVGLDHKLSVARELMHNHHVVFLVVIEEGKCCGILREADINLAISPYINTDGEQQRDLNTLNKRVHQLMQRDGFASVHQDCEITFIQRLLQDPNNQVVVVTGEHGGCVGIITADVLLQYV